MTDNTCTIDLKGLRQSLKHNKNKLIFGRSLNMSTTTGTYKLDRELIRALLQEVEASKVSRKEFDLNQLVSNKSYTFGDAGSEKRRAVQKKFCDIKRKTAHQYFKCLGKFRVAPGEAIKRELIEHEGEEEDSYEEEAEDDQGKGNEDDDISANSGSDNSSISTKSSTKKAPDSPPKKPTPKKSAPVGDIEFVPPPHERMQSDTDTTESSSGFVSASTSDSASDVLRRVKELEKVENKQDGSKENPHIIIADPEKPETCKGFEVSLVPNIKVGNHVRSVYHIRHVTAQGTEDDWSAIVPREEFPALANRSILICGPSQELWHRRTDLYHEDSFCDQTALIHEAQQTAIKQSLLRRYSFWLVVLPKGTMLENYIISHDSVNVMKGTQEMTQAFEIENDKGKPEMETLYGMDVHWRIAVAGGTIVTDPGSATKKRRKKKKVVKA
jgi:hypothetical protein